MLQELLVNIIQFIGLLFEYVGLFFIAGSVIIALVQLPLKKYTMEKVRGSLAKKIIFGLEFIIAADILLATIATNMDDIFRLGAIVLIRIMLGYALRKEIMS